jgi:glycosyltransferase involved in cell wall biosynthesis
VSELTVGVVIPSYNEGQDLINTLTSLFEQTLSFSEIIVVDDSSDGTDQLVQSTFGDQVKLIHRDRPLGRCSARNLGMQIATADVVVILNADVCLPANFCEQLKGKYSSQDIDALGVDLAITNLEHPYPRYLYAHHLCQPPQKIGWTEGFSVRRLAFLKTRGFPDGFLLPILAGEDAEFFFDLQRTDAKIAFDFELKVSTVMPVDFATIVSQIRGRASLRTLHFIYEKSMIQLFVRSILKQLYRLFLLLTIFPFCWQVFRLWNRFNQGWQDLIYYAQYELLVAWLRSYQEWSDLFRFFRLYLQKGWHLWDVLLKKPAQLLPFTDAGKSC